MPRKSHAHYILYPQRWIVLLAFFLASASTGVITASLSTNRPIILNAYHPQVTTGILQVAKYADLLLYLPCMFLSSHIIDTKGLRACIIFGSILMLFGANLRMFVSVYHGNFWPVFFGHIIALSGQAFLRNPVTKLTNNWFGDNERGIATGISIMSGPAGIFISKVLIQSIMWNDDKLEENRLRA